MDVRVIPAELKTKTDTNHMKPTLQLLKHN